MHSQGINGEGGGGGNRVMGNDQEHDALRNGFVFCEFCNEEMRDNLFDQKVLEKLLQVNGSHYTSSNTLYFVVNIEDAKCKDNDKIGLPRKKEKELFILWQ